MSEPTPDTATPEAETPPFGTYAPNAWRKGVINFTRSTPESWLGRRLAFAARRLAFAPDHEPLDIDIEGVRFRLTRKGNLCEKRLMFTPQYFDAAELAFLRKDIASRTGRPYVFMDIGANIGAYSLFVASWAGPSAQVFAFEPQPHIYKRLTDNIAFNNHGTVQPQALALTDSNEPVTLYIDEVNSGESSLKQLDTMHTSSEVKVPGMTLLDFAKSKNLSHISAMKLDVEGAEDLILSHFFANAPDELLPPFMIVENSANRWQRDIITEGQSRGYYTDQTTRMNLILRR